MRTRIPFRELHLVAESFARVEGRAPALTVAFFACLFKLRPHLRRTFPDKDYDKRTFAATFFRFIVEHLDSEEELGELLERFGQRGLLDHVTLEDSDAIGRSILGALCELEGEFWDAQTARAWKTAYAWTYAVIRDGARPLDSDLSP
jgi:hemoglobin-like flavoprotein